MFKILINILFLLFSSSVIAGEDPSENVLISIPNPKQVAHNPQLLSQKKTEKMVVCKLISNFKMSLNAIGLNIANHNATRTIEGGPYVPKEVKCINDTCKIINTKTLPMLVYKPGHPDANKEGYVAYPNVDLQLEQTKFQLIAERLIALATEKTCGMHLGLTSNSLISVYFSKNNDQAEIFVKNSHGEIIIWESLNKSSESILNLVNGKSTPVSLPGDSTIN